MIRNLLEIGKSFSIRPHSALDRCACVEDYRALAQKRLPRGVFDYFDGAAEDERAKLNNQLSFQKIEFRPRVLASVKKATETDQSIQLFGKRLSSPLICSPTGFTRIGHSEGEVAVARAARDAQLPYVMSTLSTRTIEDVGVASGTNDRWWQVYVWKDRALVRDMIDRARDAGFSALMLTVDTPVFGRRERDVRSGFTLPPKLGPGTLIDGVLHPSWTWDFVRAPPIHFENITVSSERLRRRKEQLAQGAASSPSDGAEDAVALADYINEQFDPSLNWDDVRWLREQWPDGPILLKGVQTTEDAVVAAQSGLVDGLVLSNHGGRQLDDAPAPVTLLPAVRRALVAAGHPQFPVLVDGGVRRGSDAVKAMALGASAVMFGRPYLYALGAGGQAGVTKLFSQFREDIGRTLALLGCASLSDLQASHVNVVANNTCSCRCCSDEKKCHCSEG